MKKNLSFIALTVLTVLLVVLMFVLYRPIFSPLLLLIAAIMSFGCFVSAVKDKITVKNILPIAVLCGGTLVFNMVYGADAFLNSFLLLIPVTVLIVLFCLGNVIWKKDSVRRSVNGIIAALLVVVNIYSAVTVNVRLKPKTESLQAGQDEYLNFLKRGSYKNQPNVIVILTDDMGYGDMSLFADTSIRMPNLERIAEKGIVMDNFLFGESCLFAVAFLVLNGQIFVQGQYKQRVFPDG